MQFGSRKAESQDTSSADIMSIVRELIDTEYAIALASVDAHGLPVASYVPFAGCNGRFVIVTSLLAAHTANMSGFAHASLLLAAPSGEGAYARTSLTVDVRVHHCDAGSAEVAAIWNALQRRHGDIVEKLHTGSDYTAFDLEPTRGELNVGTTATYEIDLRQLATALYLTE